MTYKLIIRSASTRKAASSRPTRRCRASPGRQFRFVDRDVRLGRQSLGRLGRQSSGRVGRDHHLTYAEAEVVVGGEAVLGEVSLLGRFGHGRRHPPLAPHGPMVVLGPEHGVVQLFDLLDDLGVQDIVRRAR